MRSILETVTTSDSVQVFHGPTRTCLYVLIKHTRLEVVNATAYPSLELCEAQELVQEVCAPTVFATYVDGVPLRASAEMLAAMPFLDAIQALREKATKTVDAELVKV